jgi:ribosome-associated translation inhibitor RaiA
VLLNTLTGITKQIRIKNDNINMTEHEMNYIADKISKALIKELDTKFQFGPPEIVEEEEELLTELAGAMTALDHNLKIENYSACERLKKQINKIEKQLNKFK